MSDPAVLPRAYRGLPPAERLAERQQRLRAAGLDLFAGQGYARTTIEQLCAAARVTARHFYQAYPSREALLVAVYDEILGDLASAVLGALTAPDADLDRTIPRAVEAMVAHYLADARRARVGVLESVGVSAAMEQRRRAAIHDMARLIEGYIQRRVAAGELPPRRYHLIAVALVGGINELLAEWLTVPEPPAITTLSAEIIVLLQALLRGAASIPPETGA